MGSRESSSNKASSDGPVPLCVAYTKRCRAKERRNGLGSARRTSRNRTHHGTQCHQEVWRSHRCRILIFPAHRIKPFKGKAQGIHTDVATGESGFARCISICSRRDNPSTCPSAVKPSTPGGAGGGGASSKLVNTHFPRFTGLVRVGLLVAIKIEACRNKPSDSFGVLTRRYLPEGMDRNP